jgi:isoquinoline 1-oxidoreductase alpha subunit
MRRRRALAGQGVLRDGAVDHLGMTGTEFGCGMGLCGACTVHMDAQSTRACVTPLSMVAGKTITTIEAVGTTPVGTAVQEAGWR